MLKIGHDQFQALDEWAMCAFDSRTLAHLQQYFPAHCAGLGEARMRQAIRRAWAAAGGHGWTPECCVRAYIEFSCLLGAGFDTDPLLPWCGELLAGTGIIDPVGDADRLHEQVWAHWPRRRQDLVDAHEAPLIDGMLAQLSRLLDAPQVDSEPLEFVQARLPSLLRSALPARLEPLDDAQLAKAVSALIERAENCGFQTGRGVMLHVLLSALMGSDFLSDRLVPWPPAAQGEAAPFGAQRVAALAQDALWTLPRWWPMAARLPA